MEEMIFKIMKTSVGFISRGQIWLFREIAKEITSHMIEFIEWVTSAKSPMAILYGDQPKRFADKDNDYTIEECYKYWLNNIKK